MDATKCHSHLDLCRVRHCLVKTTRNNPPKDWKMNLRQFSWKNGMLPCSAWTNPTQEEYSSVDRKIREYPRIL